MSTQVRWAYVLTVNAGIIPSDLTAVALPTGAEIRSWPRAGQRNLECSTTLTLDIWCWICYMWRKLHKLSTQFGVFMQTRLTFTAHQATEVEAAAFVAKFCERLRVNIWTIVGFWGYERGRYLFVILHNFTKQSLAKCSWLDAKMKSCSGKVVGLKESVTDVRRKDSRTYICMCGLSTCVSLCALFVTVCVVYGECL